jgi:predicted  nucleic acid-binding Zn-ribbon protein
MDHPKYLRFFSTGDLLTLVAAVVAVAVAWGSMSAQMSHQGEEIAAMRAQIEELSNLRITPDADARLRVLESDVAATRRDRDELKADIAKRLDVLEAQNREILQRLPKR